MAIIPLILMIIGMSITIIVIEGTPHIPLVLGILVAALVALKCGFEWKHIEEGMYNGVKMVISAVLILMSVGMIIGAWIGGGIVASMTYYGLKILSPSYFLVAITLICAVVSLAIGSSWSTMATIGVAGMGIGISMGIPAPMIAGAIISGAYFGDKMSPLSDTTLLASGLSGSNLVEHIRHMFYTTIPGLLIALVAYWFMGRKYASDAIASNDINTVLAVMQENFIISPWLLLVPAVVIILVAKKMPALPAIIIGTILGLLSHVFIQGGAIGDAMATLQSGYSIESGNELVDSLLNRGGIDGMLYTTSLAIIAAVFGGVLESTGMLAAIVGQILRLVRSDGGLLSATVGTAFVSNIAAADQYMSIVVPSRMYANAYKERNLHPKNLSRALEDGGTITSSLVPWNTCAVFIVGTLGVETLAYAPYAIMNLSVPIISIVFSLLGITVVKMKTDTSVSSKKSLAFEDAM